MNDAQIIQFYQLDQSKVKEATEAKTSSSFREADLANLEVKCAKSN